MEARNENESNGLQLIGRGISELSVIPLRLEPSERSEMVTQALYGESMVLLEEHSDWFRVQLSDDGYQGWCSKKMITECAKEEWHAVSKIKPRFVTEVISYCHSFRGNYLLPASSRLFPDDVLVNGGRTYTPPDVKNINPAVIAQRFLHAPYLWGGKTIFGIDCSGLVQVVMKLKGHNLPRDAAQQAVFGQTVSSLEETLPGDMAFFSDSSGRIIHVGLVMADASIIHASGSVRIDSLDKTGIYNSGMGQYTHQLSHIRRLAF